jgi:hypothetical protein
MPVHTPSARDMHKCTCQRMCAWKKASAKAKQLVICTCRMNAGRINRGNSLRNEQARMIGQFLEGAGAFTSANTAVSHRLDPASPAGKLSAFVPRNIAATAHEQSCANSEPRRARRIEGEGKSVFSFSSPRRPCPSSERTEWPGSGDETSALLLGCCFSAVGARALFCVRRRVRSSGQPRRSNTS